MILSTGRTVRFLPKQTSDALCHSEYTLHISEYDARVQTVYRGERSDTTHCTNPSLLMNVCPIQE